MKHLACLTFLALIGVTPIASAQTQAPAPALAPAPAPALAPVNPEFAAIAADSLPQPIFVPGGFCALSQVVNGTQSCARKVSFVQQTDPAFGGSEKAILARAAGMSPDNPHYTATITALDN